MNKRSKKQIELDVAAIKEAAKTASTLKELAEITGLSIQKVRTSLDHHPIIKKRVMASLDANKAKEVCVPTATVEENTSISIVHHSKEDCKSLVICDCPSLMYGLSSCMETSIVIPRFVKDTLIGISKSSDANAETAKKVLVKINTVANWCTIAPRIDEVLFNDPPFKISWRTKALIALACKYWVEGYQVTIKTRTAEIAKVAALQECLKVDFVKADDKVSLKIVRVS